MTWLSIAVSLFSTPWSLPGSLLETIQARHTYCLFLCQTHTPLLSRRVYKTFNCKLFYAGDNPGANLPSKDIFCGQLEDESQRKRYNKRREGEKKKKHEREQAREKESSERQFCEWMKKSCMCSSCQLLFGITAQQRHAVLILVGHLTLASVHALPALEINYMCGTFVA